MDSVAESPDMGKARHIRNGITSTPEPQTFCSSSFSSPCLQTQEDSDVHTDMESSPPLLEDCRIEQHKGKDRGRLQNSRNIS